MSESRFTDQSDDFRLRMWCGTSWRDYSESVKLMQRLMTPGIREMMMWEPRDLSEENFVQLAQRLVTGLATNMKAVISAMARDPAATWWLTHFANDAAWPEDLRRHARNKIARNAEVGQATGSLRNRSDRRSRISWTTRLFDKEAYQSNILNDLELRVCYGCQPDPGTDARRQYAESIKLIRRLEKTKFDPLPLLEARLGDFEREMEEKSDGELIATRQAPFGLLAYCLVVGAPFDPAAAAALFAESERAWLQFFADDEVVAQPLREIARKALRGHSLEERAAARERSDETEPPAAATPDATKSSIEQPAAQAQMP